VVKILYLKKKELNQERKNPEVTYSRYSNWQEQKLFNFFAFSFCYFIFYLENVGRGGRIILNWSPSSLTPELYVSLSSTVACPPSTIGPLSHLIVTAFPIGLPQVSLGLTNPCIIGSYFFRGLFIAVMMEAVCISEMSFYSETTWRYIPEGSNLHTQSHENLKNHKY
jgi:hypothetical protein